MLVKLNNTPLTSSLVVKIGWRIRNYFLEVQPEYNQYIIYNQLP